MIEFTQEREKLSDAWRILGYLDLTDTVFNHISYCFEHHGQLMVAMNPTGKLASHVEAADVRIFYLDSSSSDPAINVDGLALHRTVHLQRQKPGAAVHTHSVNVTAVSAIPDGLLPLSQTAMEFSQSIRILDYSGLFRTDSDKEGLEEIAHGGVALLRNHGSFVVTDTIEEALYVTYYLEQACKIQVAILSQGRGYVMPPAEHVNATHADLRNDRLSLSLQLFEAWRQVLLGKDPL